MSSALDTVLFLLLVTAAVGALTLPGPTARPPDAAGTMERLGTVTANPTYTLAPGAQWADESLVEFPLESGPEFERTAHGSLAVLLADAAVGNLTVDGQELDHASEDYERRVRGAVENTTGPRVHVRAVWRPYPDAPVRGQVAAGATPPPDARVAAVTRTLDSGYPAVRGRAVDAARAEGWRGVARVVAGAVVRGTLPPSRSRFALRADYPVDALVRYRYHRFATALGTNVSGAVAAVEPRRANAELERALARRLEGDLRQSFDSPEAAARAVRVGTVRLVVRRWRRG